MLTNKTHLAPALGFLLVLAACGGGGGPGDTGIPGATPRPGIPGTTPWRGNTAAQDLLDHWNEPGPLRQRMGLSDVPDAELASHRSALATLLAAARRDPDASGTQLRNVRPEDVEIIGERDGITYGQWTGGPAGTLNIEFDFRFAEGLGTEARARMERAGKAWSYRLLDDFHANTVESGTEIVHDVNLDGAESRTVIFEEDVPVDDVLIAVLYTGTSSGFPPRGPSGGTPPRTTTSPGSERSCSRAATSTEPA